jgi:predicted transposase YdaD
MTVLRESPWYQEILKEGLQQGEQQGLQQGLQQGEASLVIKLLSKRFGELDQTLVSQIRRLQVPQLEALGESLLDFSQLQDLNNWLRNEE